jgi:hypothetical protein
MTEVLGRKITRRNVSKQGILQRGIPKDYVVFKSIADQHNADGAERWLQPSGFRRRQDASGFHIEVNKDADA